MHAPLLSPGGVHFYNPVHIHRKTAVPGGHLPPAVVTRPDTGRNGRLPVAVCHIYNVFPWCEPSQPARGRPGQERPCRDTAMQTDM